MKRKAPEKKLFPNWSPSGPKFRDIVDQVRKSRSRWCDATADFIEGLAYSGMRKEEAARMTWADIDYDRKLMAIHGSKTDSADRIVPPIPAMIYLGWRRMDQRYSKVNSALTSLAKACKIVGVKKLNHHDLRHLYATVIESGVDIPMLIQVARPC